MKRQIGLFAAALLSACDAAELDFDLAVSSRVTQAIGLASSNGCRIDNDCHDSLFCLQNRCVWECQEDRHCASDEVCSPRSRCMPAQMSVGESAAAASKEELVVAPTSSVDVLEWPELTLEVPSGAPFVEAKLRTAAAIPGGALTYFYESADAESLEPPQVQRVTGTTEFALRIPTGKAGAADPEPSVVRLVTPLGTRTLYLMPKHTRAGAYAGTFVPRSFGGAGLPLEIVLETKPTHAASLREAEEAFVWIPTSTRALISLAGPREQSDFVRQKLTRDESIGAWVATFSEAVEGRRYFGEDLYPEMGRALRVELHSDEGGELRGALSDRLLGLFERRSTDGVVEPGIALVSGEFVLSRVGGVPAAGRVREARHEGFSAPSLARPSFDACSDDLFASIEAKEAGASPCAGVATAEQFRTASLEARSACALAVADKALAGESIAAMLRALLDPDQPNPGGLSFQAFLEECAAEHKPLCQPTPAIHCARALTADAYRDARASGADMAKLSEAYERTTREAFVGRKLAAFQVDTQSRLNWLRTSEAPPFLASSLRDYNEQILESWKSGVLTAHLEGVFGQLDRAGLSVLSRATTDPAAMARRAELLLELASSWRASMDALVLLTSRWNVLYQNANRRAEGAEFVRARAFRLYVVAAILQELNRETGASHVSSTFGSGFSVLMRELSRLQQPFDKLLFARDAEVVASRSVNPEQSARSMLSELEQAARKATADAAKSVDRVLDEAQRTQLTEAGLSARFEDQLLSLRNELIALCGLPVGCTPADVGVEAGCDVPVQAGRCGFVVSRGSLGQPSLPTAAESISEAGTALLSLKGAAQGKREAEEKLRAHVQKASLQTATAEAFAKKVQEWDASRRATGREVDALLREAASFRDAALQAEIMQIQRDQAMRERAYEQQRASVQHWNEIRISGVESDLTKLGRMTDLNIASEALGLTASRVDLFADIFNDAQPAQVGTTTDPSFIARLSVRFPAAIASTVLSTLAFATNTAASLVGVQLAGQQALREAELEHLYDLAELGEELAETSISRLEAQAELQQLSSERETATLRALIDALQRNLELDLAHEANLKELRDRRDALRSMLVDATRLEYEAMQADLTGRQRELAYYEVVQRAQLLEGRFRNMQLRFQDLETLLGSPEAMFSFADRMALAESRLDRARRSLEDWLVALEYYAVRPFVDQRMAILLARNPAQLEAIANEMLRLSRACGGPVTTETLQVSLRDDLLQMGYAVEGTDSQSEGAAERFRTLLARAEAPVRRDVAYSARESLGSRMGRGNMLAVSFDLQVSAFANLSRTCNAKLESIAIELVGEGLGSGRPVVAVAYDGVGQLRSCQPDLDAYVAQFGQDATAFASTTSFRTAGRVIAPVAGVGALGPEFSWNATLEGLPLASQYTVLIDLEHPSNKQIDWSRLEDVRLQFRYGYQDVFPRGQCQ